MIRSTSQLIIDKSALKNNIDFVRGYLNPGTRVSSVVKANAYGHGLNAFVPIAEEAGIDHFSVFSADEAYKVSLIKSPDTEIMIMGWIDDVELEWVIQNNVDFWIFEVIFLEKAIKKARKLGKIARVHLELETGMNRTGLIRKDLNKAVKLISENLDACELAGLCTHYAGAESIANHVRVQNQMKRFNRLKKWVIASGLNPGMCHTACSAAALTYPKTCMDMVRIGIIQYGFWPSRETFIHYIHPKRDKSDPLHRVLTWKSQIMSLKKVKQGEFVSYGTTYLAQEDKTIAIIPVGYSHGFDRDLSNQGRVLIRGHRTGVIGMVNMNMVIADVTNIPGVQIGDEVILIGQQGDNVISVASFSEISNRVNYELLARLPGDIERIVIN